MSHDFTERDSIDEDLIYRLANAPEGELSNVVRDIADNGGPAAVFDAITMLATCVETLADERGHRDLVCGGVFLAARKADDILNGGVGSLDGDRIAAPVGIAALLQLLVDAARHCLRDVADNDGGVSIIGNGARALVIDGDEFDPTIFDTLD